MNQMGKAVIQKAHTLVPNAPAGSVLLTRRGEQGLEHYFIPPDIGRPGTAAVQLGQTVAARADEIEDNVPPLFESDYLSMMAFRVGSIIGHDSQAGADLLLVVHLRKWTRRQIAAG